MTTLYGVAISPFVRKVQVYMAERNLPYDLQVVPPHSKDEPFVSLSPLGRIPAYRDEQIGLCDSSVIVAYLEKRHGAELLPDNSADYARALWFEEYADTTLADVLVSGLFLEEIGKPKLFKTETNHDNIQKALEKGLPRVFGYLESQLGDNDYLVGNRFSLADISVVSDFVNFQHTGRSVDARQWPRLAAYVERVLARPSFQACLTAEQAFLATLPG
ncbi:MAG: glutathione S-transferase family protein [Gammaproteobacteria bacterium]|nr:glutathione S-transferase family protein [Gammaproteobacteria bacterium]